MKSAGLAASPAAELLTGMLALGLTAVAAAAAALRAAGFGLAVQTATAAATAICLGLVWPVTLHHVRRPPPLHTGTYALIGRIAVVVQDYGAAGGRIRIGGEEWSCCSYDANWSSPQVSPWDVIEIGGAMAPFYPPE